MTTRFKTIRCTDEELETWRKASGGNLNGWIRRTLRQQVEAQEALARMERAESGLSNKTESSV